jgi:hypothetical protein
MRRGDSCFVYHEDVIRDTAGKNGPSVKPTRKRQTQNDHPLFIAGIQIVTTDQASIQHGMRMRGLPLARDDVADVEHGDTGGPHDIVHAEILLHAGETGVGDIDAIEIATNRSCQRGLMTR